jgi:acetyl esterase/lipase
MSTYEHRGLTPSVQQVRDNAKELNVQPESISIGGISAGGHISAVCQQLARDANINLKLGTSHPSPQDHGLDRH